MKEKHPCGTDVWFQMPKKGFGPSDSNILVRNVLFLKNHVSSDMPEGHCKIVFILPEVGKFCFYVTDLTEE